MRDQQFYKSEAVKDRNIFKKEIVLRNLILLQEKCHFCNATLSNPIKVSENVIVALFKEFSKIILVMLNSAYFVDISIDIRHVYMGFTIMMIVFSWVLMFVFF